MRVAREPPKGERKDSSWSTVSVAGDSRITPFGAKLRHWKLEELPGLWDVLIGNMSFVGPRPVTDRELDDNFTEEEKKLLLSAKPGLISYWGVHGRSKVTWESKDRQKLELEYFYHRSLWCDFVLMLRAIPAVLKADGSK
jgi:lipopolysaccharide/colanic/teichoic acid biosynthesis glycosyltransferase